MISVRQHLRLFCAAAFLLLGQDAPAASGLRRVMVPEPSVPEEVTYDIGTLIAAGRVQPRAAIEIASVREGCWLVRGPQSPSAIRWPRDLLNAGPRAPELTIETRLVGRYDVYVHVRAVDAGGAVAGKAAPSDFLPMAFELALDDGSQREVVGAKGFPDYHFDTEVLAGHRWRLDGRKLILRSLGKPVYLYGFRFVPCPCSDDATSRMVSRWLATDHVTIVAEPDKHFAFPGAARLANGDLVVVYREGTIHEADPTGKISLSRSTDGGRTWLPRVTALDRPGVDDRDPSVFQMSNGTLFLFSADCVCISRDDGRDMEPAPAHARVRPQGRRGGRGRTHRLWGLAARGATRLHLDSRRTRHSPSRRRFPIPGSGPVLGAGRRGHLHVVYSRAERLRLV